MKYLERASTLLTLVEQLKEVGSWCGETHFQKSTYFLQEMLGVPLAFHFVLYKHGPYSFDLADFVTEMRADELVGIEPQYPYGVSINPTPNAQRVFELCPAPRQQYGAPVSFLARRLGHLGATDLEKQATAFWVFRECPQCQAEERANRLSELKPHVTLQESRRAVVDVEKLQREAKQL